VVLMFAADAACSAPTVESDAQISSASSQKSSWPSVMKMMYLSPGDVMAVSAAGAALIEYIAGDSNFLPVVEDSLSTGQARPSYFVLMTDALFIAGGTLSASVPAITGPDPTPPAGLVP